MKTTCIHGHPWLPENLIKNGVRNGRQKYKCKTCEAIQHKRTYKPHPIPRLNGPRPNAVPADDAFLHWLAGFIDGEGCFSIRLMPRGNWWCSFRLSLRDDDRRILEEIRDRTALGNVTALASASLLRMGMPQAVWTLGSKADCLRLIEILDAHPLRAKKAMDYRIWREAVLNWATARKSHEHDWTVVADCKRRLLEVRTYRR